MEVSESPTPSTVSSRVVLPVGRGDERRSCDRAGLPGNMEMIESLTWLFLYPVITVNGQIQEQGLLRAQISRLRRLRSESLGPRGGTR